MKKRLYFGEKSGETREEATRWMARKMSGAMSEKEKAELETWLAASKENAAEFGDLENLLTAADAGGETLLSEQFEAELFKQESARRFSVGIRVAALIVACIIGGAIGLRAVGAFG